MNYKDYSKINNINLNSEDRVFELSNLITEARLHAGLSQAALARKIGTQQPSIARAENGMVKPSIEFLEKIAKAIGTYLIPPKFGFMIEREMASQNYINAAFQKNNRLVCSEPSAKVESISLKSSYFQVTDYSIKSSTRYHAVTEK